MRLRLLLCPVVFAAAAAAAAACSGPSSPSTHAVSPLDGTSPLVQWAHRYQLAAEGEQDALLQEGVALADLRRQALLSSAKVSPESVLAERLPWFVYDALPQAVRTRMEQPVDAVAEYEVIVVDDDDGSHRVERFLLVGERRYEAVVHGRRLGIGSKERLRIHGLAIGDTLVVSDSPLRELEPGEPAPAGKAMAGTSACASPKRIDTGAEVVSTCTDEEVAALAETFVEAEHLLGPSDDVTVASTWAKGHKPVLYIRVDFSDKPGEPISAGAAQQMIDVTVNQWYQDASFGQTSYSATVTPVFRMPRPASWYEEGTNYYQLRNDAITAARAAGYDDLAYARDITAYARISGGYSGRGQLGGRGTWLNGSFGLRVTAHELGHNNGLHHASRLQVAHDQVIGEGDVTEYGNPFDVMGGSQNGHFHPWYKHRLGWIPVARAETVTHSGVYRLYDFQQPASGTQALAIQKDGNHSYALEYRPIAGRPHHLNGIGFNLVHRIPTRQSQMLDLTPHTPTNTSAGSYDSTLVVGRTYSDRAANVHITPMSVGTGTPGFVDVAISVSPPPGTPPTASLTASSERLLPGEKVELRVTAFNRQRDFLAYYWDFDDGQTLGNETAVTHPFGQPGRYNVRCTVSDLKGNAVTVSKLITVGSGGGRVVSGVIRHDGEPVEGVRVTSGARTTWTDSQGVYRLTRLGTASLPLTVVHPDYVFTPRFVHPIPGGPGDVVNADYDAQPRPTRTITGRVTSAGAPLAGVRVRAGIHETTTTAAGEYAFTGLPDGHTYALTATYASGRHLDPVNFTNPVTLDSDLHGMDFKERMYTLSGVLHGNGAFATVSDGVRIGITTRAGTGRYRYQIRNVPFGTYSLFAMKNGSTLMPLFTNPVNVSVDVEDLDFEVTPGASYLIRGRLLTSDGVPLAGATVSAGGRTAIADWLGNYALPAMPNGTYLVTPSHSRGTFTPASRQVVVDGGDVTGVDFVSSPSER